MKKRQKPARSSKATKSAAQKIRVRHIRKSFQIDDWKLISTNLSNATLALAHCQYDFHPIKDFLTFIYAVAFTHGVSRGLRHASRSKVRLKLKTSKGSPKPSEVVREAVGMFAADLFTAHPRRQGPPELRN